MSAAFGPSPSSPRHQANPATYGLILRIRRDHPHSRPIATTLRSTLCPVQTSGKLPHWRTMLSFTSRSGLSRFTAWTPSKLVTLGLLHPPSRPPVWPPGAKWRPQYKALFWQNQRRFLCASSLIPQHLFPSDSLGVAVGVGWSGDFENLSRGQLTRVWGSLLGWLGTRSIAGIERDGRGSPPPTRGPVPTMVQRHRTMCRSCSHRSCSTRIS